MGRPPVMRWTLATWVMLGSLALTTGAAARTHPVQSGDSLWALAKRYGVSVEAIQKANKLTSDKIRQGQNLAIPGSAAQKSSTKATAKAPKVSPKPQSSKQSQPPKQNKAQPEQSKTQPKPQPPKQSKTPEKPASAKPTAQSKRSTSTSSAKPAPQTAPKKATPVKPAPAKQTPASPVTKQDLAAAEELYSRDETVPPSTLEEIAPAWVLARPGASTQGEKTNAARGGIYPCVAPDPGFGGYGKWVQVAPMAHVLAPAHPQLSTEGTFDVVFHFHGREPIRKEWVKSMKSAVLVAIDVGIDSGSYATAFSDPRTFRSVTQAVEAELSKRTGNPNARAGNIALSSWSAGFGAVEAILSQPYGKRVVDTVILLDGLHSGYAGQSLDKARMEPFVEFAQRAAKGERLFFVSHSSILTTGYASTTETANYLIWKVGGRPGSAEPLKADPMGLERMVAYSEGGFHVRGFRGSGTADHCAHLGLMRDVLRVHLEPRWRDRESRGAEAPEAVAMQANVTRPED